MDLYPAIDLLDGRCVRLYQGDYDRSTVYGDDPVAQALAFQSEGAPWVHVVDLDAARTGEPRNRDVVAAIAGLMGAYGAALLALRRCAGQEERTPLSSAGLRSLEITTKSVRCRGCGAATTLEWPVLACGSCDSRDVELVSGEELLVVAIDVTVVA